MSIFETVKVPDIPRSSFDLSHKHDTTYDMGYAVPLLRQEVLPGDTFYFGDEHLLRFKPLVSPAYINVTNKMRYFFVPNRILMDQTDWEAFIMGDQDAAIEWPHVRIGNDTNPIGSLGHYMGYPILTGANTLDVSVLPIAAYCKIWDDYYRSDTLQAEIFRKVIPGLQSGGFYESLIAAPPKPVGWMRDYFTSALPTPQKGDPVLIPLTNGDTTPVIVSNRTDTLWRKVSDGTVAGDGTLEQQFSRTEIGTDSVYYDPTGTLEVDDAVLNSNAATIDTLRTAFKLQQYFETWMRAGTRYFEWVRSFFRTTPSDARLQRAEYIGTSVSRMQVSEVLSTANTEVDTEITPVGQMAGRGIAVGGGKRHSYTAEEHGWIIGIMQSTPDTSYYQGVDRCLIRETYLDYAIPMFANIGEQETLTKEIWANDTAVNQNTPIGYQPRFAEYRFNNSRVSGEFVDTLKFWTLVREFSSRPTLPSIIAADTVSDRIFAVSEGHQIYAEIVFNIYCKRNLPRFGVPSLM